MRSVLISSGIVRMTRYPLDAATIARPIPVLPLVGSTMVPPGFSRPSCSAFSIMLSPIRSFTLPPGLKDSSLTSVSAHPSFGMRFRRTIGVLPISWQMLSHTALSMGFLASDLIVYGPVSYTHLRAHETPEHLVCRLL